MPLRWSPSWLGRVLAEFAVIVLGVLVALGVDDWQSRRAGMIRESYILASLGEDLRADIADFEAARANAQMRAAAARYILVEMGGPMPADAAIVPIGPSRPSPFAPDSLAPTPRDLTDAVQRVAAVANFDFTAGTYEEVLSTGELALIRSDSLRRAISRYYSFAADRLEADQRIRESLFQYLEALRVAGLALGDDGERLRRVPPERLEQLMAAIRLAWGFAAVQSTIAEELTGVARELLEQVDRAETS